ncbi:ABC transporter permease [Tenggerimyces flavus]|uniref:Transport permease protein n=1 Tax=Tenggerimyces flavus TaxID=1708749 RepID=A0ABV7Y423_9ACTN|nr:ABC transporter permease [Tenggerimyces flavus]MBM7790705.1 ABC-2 type transport system permease protein [Tenggerimyces flavus]
MTVALLGRAYLLLRRQPIMIPIMFVQPLVWLLLYSQLFGDLPRLGGFGTDSYLQYLAPGVAIMTAFSHGAWEGPGVVEDLERGAFDRFLATSLPAGALLAARGLQAAVIGALQALVVVAVAFAFGARLAGGVAGLLAILVAAALVGAVFAGVSHALALTFRRQQTMIAVGQFAVLPFMFLSTTLTAFDQLPEWIRGVAGANPVNWAVEASRSAMLGTDWTSVAVHLGALAVLVVATQAVALLALHRYRRVL